MTNNFCDIGFDIGITSIGAAVAADHDLKYLGVRVFNAANEASDSRTHRSARRNLARKKWRKQQLGIAFEDFGLLTHDQINSKNFACFTAHSETFAPPLDKTVYHLRKRALSERISERELYLCFMNMLHARGHFNMETYDFSKGTITFEEYKDRFYNSTESYFYVYDDEKSAFEKDILQKIFDGSADTKLLRTVTKHRYTDEESEAALLETLRLLCGYKSRIKQISESFSVDKDSVNITTLKSLDEIDEFFTECIDLYDMGRISRILKEDSYLCEKAVREIDRYEEMFTTVDHNSDQYKEYMKELQIISNNKKRTRAWRNIDNNYPNGLYVKEARAILKKQQEFNDRITDDFIEAVLSIISARIPYYIGPLNVNGKNAWVVKPDEARFKYSYAYTQKHMQTGVDEEASIKAWKERMISRCTYLPDQYALPKGSFIAETFNILNELNILSAEDSDGNEYYLTLEDKIRIFDHLFLLKKKVKYEDVADLLGLKGFGPKRKELRSQLFKSEYSIYHQIAAIDPDLRLISIMELFDEPDKIQKIEEIALRINLYDEEASKINVMVNEFGYLPDAAAKLARLNTTGFYAFSKAFIYSTVIDDDGNTILSRLFKDNSAEGKNEQMSIISSATDGHGNHVDYVSNKYIRKLKDNGGELNINLLMDDGIPVIPMSRPVVRALNECMKMYNEIVKVYGVPGRVVIETARDFRDHSEVGTVPEHRFKTVQNLYENLVQQIKDKKLYDADRNLEDWDKIEQYVTKNAMKIELYLRQNGTDLLTGEKIDINRLNDYEIDHILPRGFGDDSKDDKMLISRTANAKKGNRLPLQFIESGEKINGKFTTTGEYMRRVKELFDARLISEQKYRRLTLASESELDGFINQNLVDTRYIIREFMSILRAYNQVHGCNTHIVALKSAYTSTYRKAMGMDKERGFGDQHHAHDAALVLVADRTLSAMYPNYDQRKNAKSVNSSLNSYQGFINMMLDSKDAASETNKESMKSLNQFIQRAYKKAYGIDYDAPGSFIRQVKETVPFYSVKTEKNYSGKYFEATILPQPTKDKDKKDQEGKPLTILGVNDKTKIFSGIECAAVDFYKFTNNKGKKEHLAVHIPKVIISKDGVINKEKYLSLIRDYYKKPELIDENGELKEYYFRFRAFRNDIIYDTVANDPALFNIGSMANKKLEKKFFDIYSYNDIYVRGNKIRELIVSHFNIKTRNNPNGIQFSELSKEAIIRYAIHHIWIHGDSISEAVEKTVINNTETEKNIYDLSNKLSYYELTTKRYDYPPTITGQYAPVINPNYFKGDEDAQYIKLKYNILGLRFSKTFYGKMDIESPSEIPGAYKKIRKEEFSWRISKL